MPGMRLRGELLGGRRQAIPNMPGAPPVVANDDGDESVSASAPAPTLDKSARVYVGNLKPKVGEAHLTDLFARFGALANVWVARKPPGFAFVQFDRPSDAQRAVRAFEADHSPEILGQRAKVQMAGAKVTNKVSAATNQAGSSDQSREIKNHRHQSTGDNGQSDGGTHHSRRSCNRNRCRSRSTERANRGYDSSQMPRGSSMRHYRSSSRSRSASRSRGRKRAFKQRRETPSSRTFRRSCSRGRSRERTHNEACSGYRRSHSHRSPTESVYRCRQLHRDQSRSKSPETRRRRRSPPVRTRRSRSRSRSRRQSRR